MAKEDKWIEVLSGKSKPNSRNKAEIEASYLREAIGSYEKKIGLNNPNPEFSFYRFEQLLKEKDQHKASTGFLNKLKLYKWETLRLIAATATGIAIATLPTAQLATKSGNNKEVILNGGVVIQQIVINSEITLNDPYPITFAKLIIQRSIESGMVAKVSGSLGKRDNDKIELIIYGFKANDLNQTRLKLILKSNNQLEGNVKIILKKNNRN